MLRFGCRKMYRKFRSSVCFRDTVRFQETDSVRLSVRVSVRHWVRSSDEVTTVLGLWLQNGVGSVSFSDRLRLSLGLGSGFSLGTVFRTVFIMVSGTQHD